MLKKYNTLYFETTRRCNLKCAFCSTGSQKPINYSDVPFEKIIDFVLMPAFELGTRFVDFSGGEFLMRKDAMNLLSQANNIGFGIGIASNGILLSERKLLQIKDTVGDNVIISLGINSIDSNNVYTRSVEVGDVLKKIELIDKIGIRANISVTIGDYNKASFEKTIDYITNKLKLPFNRIPFVPRNCCEDKLMINKQSLKDYFHPILRRHFKGQVSYIPYFLPQENYEKSSGQDLNIEQVPVNPSVGCWVGSYYAINPEGEVSPCPMFLDHVSGGNVYKTPLKEILFESELFKKITDRKNLEGKCGNCKYTYTCGGCRVMAYYLTGNVFAEDPTCFIDELSEEELLLMEQQTIKSFKNYVRMAKFGGIFHNPYSNNTDV